jgi:hypothetical protein
MSPKFPELPPDLQSIYEALKREAAPIGDGSENDGEKIDNAGKIAHCLSHIVMAVQTYALKLGDATRLEAEKKIRGLLANAAEYEFPEGTSPEAEEAAMQKLREFESVVFSEVSEEPDPKYPDRVSETFHLPERPDEKYVERVRRQHKNTLASFPGVAGGQSPVSDETA